MFVISYMPKLCASRGNVAIESTPLQMNDHRDMLDDSRVPAYHCGKETKGSLPMRTEYDLPSLAKPLNFTSFHALFTHFKVSSLVYLTCFESLQHSASLTCDSTASTLSFVTNLVWLIFVL